MAGIPRGFERYRPWWRGWYQGYGFNPVADLPGLALYHDIKVQDSTFQGLPGMAYAINQNDGIGAVLDIKRYKERGPELVTTPEIQGKPITVPGGTDATSTYATGANVVKGKLYEIEFTVTGFDGVSDVGIVAASFPLAVGVTRLSADGTARGLAVASADGVVRFFTRTGNTANFSGISVREIPGYHATQDVAANQPVLNIENGIRSALFDGVDDRLVIPDSAGAFNFLHNGAGGEIHWCGRASALDIVRYLFGNGNAGRNGCIASAAPNGSVGVSIGNASGTYAASATAPIGTLTVGEVAVIGFSLTSDTLTIFKNGQVVASAAVSGELSSGDPEFDFTVGRWNPNSGSCFSGGLYSIALAQGILSDYDRQRLATYMLRRAGA